MRQITLIITLLSLIACSSLRENNPQNEATTTITKRDFFFYDCVHQYMIAHSIKIFDASLGLAAELSKFSFEEFNDINRAAKKIALGIRAPDYTDKEHGLSAVLMICQDESKKYLN